MPGPVSRQGPAPGASNAQRAAAFLVPSSDGQNGVVVKVPDADWGTETGHGYGTAQAFMVLREGAGTVEPDDVVLFRVNGRGSVGLCGGLHIALGLRQRAGDPFTQSIWISPQVDSIGIIVDAATDTPAQPFQQWRFKTGSVAVEIASTGALKANRSLEVHGSAGAVAAFMVGNSTALDVQLAAVGSAGQIYSGTGVGDSILRTLGAGTRLRLGGISNEAISVGGGGLSFFGGALQAKKAITGSRGANAALASLLTQLAGYGLITDSTTA